MDILPLEAKESSYYHSDPDASETEYFNEGVRLSRVMSLPPRFGREVKEVPDVLVTSLEDDGARKGVDSPDMKVAILNCVCVGSVHSVWRECIKGGCMYACLATASSGLHSPGTASN